MSARVAVVRGSTLNPWEMQNLEPLADRFDLMLVGSRGSRIPMDPVSLPLCRLPEAGWLAERMPLRPLRWRLQRHLRLRHLQHYLLGLEWVLRDRDLVHAVDFHYGFSLQAARSCQRRGSPLVITRWENLPFAYHRYGACFDPSRYALVARAARVVAATSRSAAEALKEEGTETGRVEVIYPGVDLERFRPGPEPAGLRRRLGLPPEVPVVLFVGRLVWEKGCLDLVRAFSRLSRPAHLLLVGRGPEQPLLEEVVQRRGLTGRVTLRAGLPYRELPDLYRLATVFALPSIPTAGWEEQFGMVLAEALASGVPVIASRSGAIPEVVGSAGWLVEPHRPLELADALEGVLGEPGRARDMAQAARQRAEAALDRIRYAREMAQVYDSLL